MNKKIALQIIILALISTAALFIIEQGLQVSYLIKTVAKIGMFLVLPLFFIKFVIKQPVLEFLNLRTIDTKNLRLGFLLGLVSMGIVIGAFFVLQDFINTGAIIDDLQTRMKVTAEIFVFIAIYITFGNSLLEEFYFRGFIFLNIYKTGNKAVAYLFSSVLFAIYHVAIFATWFNIWLMLLALLGLFIVGLVFNWLNTKSMNFLNSWILHIFADIGVMVLGFYLFGFFG